MLQISRMVMLVCLAVLSFMDIRHRKVPAGFIGALFLAAVLKVLIMKEPGAPMAAAGAAAGLIFIGISKVTREQMGYGDSIFILVLGIYLGLQDLIAVLIVAFTLTGLVAGAVFLIKKLQRKQTLPFFPFLTIGYFVMLVFEGGWK